MQFRCLSTVCFKNQLGKEGALYPVAAQILKRTHTLTRILTQIHYHTHSDTLAQAHSLAHTHTIAQTHSRTNSHTYTLKHTLAQTLSLAHSRT